MNKKPILFLYCQHSLGMGHLRRTIEIAKALNNKFRVIFFNGGRIPAEIPRPENIEFIDLLPLGMGANGVLISQSNEQDLTIIKETRRQLLLEHYHRLQPDVLFVELFPFGRKKFAFELLPLLRMAKKSDPKPLVVCDLRDILVDDRRDQQRHDDRACWLSKRYFDAILIHTDPDFSRLEESFKPRLPLKTPVFYTGFVAGDVEINEDYDQNPGIVVSAGGGNVGASLFHAAVEAQPIILERYRLPMSIVAGPFLPESEWNLLKLNAQNKKGLTLYRSVPDLKCLLQHATVSISQCGYNTVMDVLKTHVSALLIPYAEGRENEQTKRALKLEKMKIGRVLAETELTTNNLVREIDLLLLFSPKPIELQMDGANKSSEIIFDLLEKLSNQSGKLNHVA
jgi:predicted glycosyltransferase